MAEHGFGTLTLDGVPERIVTLADRCEFDSLLSLGTRPAATGLLYGETAFRPWTAGVDTDGIETFEGNQGLTDLLNLEVIAAQQPDLMMGPTQFSDEAIVERLAAIAATVGTPALAPGDFGWWEDVLALVAAVVDRDEAVPGIIAEVETALARGEEALRDRGIGEVTLMSVYEGSGVYVFTDANPQGALLARLGLTRPAAQREQFVDGPDAGYDLSQERLGELDADLVLLMDYDPAAADALEADPLFQAVPAVADGRFVRLPFEVADAMYFHSPLSLPWVVDQIGDRLPGGA